MWMRRSRARIVQDDKPNSLGEERVKHLEIIQNIITRFSSNSFLIKGWAITVTAALYAYAASRSSWQIALPAPLPAIAFWYLDSYYLRQERAFRLLFEDVRNMSPGTERFSMNINPYIKKASIFKTGTSRTILPFYSTIIIIGVSLAAWAQFSK
jgi:hypothetical protein